MIAAIVGPTACGKTAVSIEVAKALNAEIISADSVQVYRGLDIGSAKPSEDERQGIVHHMMDCVPPTRSGFTVAEYQRMAFACIDNVLERQKVPLIVGGTGLYIRALTSAMDFSEAVGDASFREFWQAKESLNPGIAHRELQKIDPEAALRLHPNDARRIVRALEINHLTGKTISEHSAEDRLRPPRYPSVVAGLTMPREKLYSRIETRVDQMLADGLVAEVEALLTSACSPESTSLQGLGYKEIVHALLSTPANSKEREAALDEAASAIKIGTRHFAKRQWTWFRRDENIRWFDMDELSLAEASEAITKYFESKLIANEE